MTSARISESLTKFFSKALSCSRLAALLVIATLAAAVPARAQSSDTWKSVAIIGGSTAAGAYIGHRVGGTTGAYVGAAVGATAGYAIDRKRRQNEYNNYGYNNDGGYYPSNGGYYPSNGNGGYYPNDGYYGNNDPSYGNGGYYGGPYGNGFNANSKHLTSRRR